MMIIFTKSVSNRPVMVNSDHIVKISPIQGKDGTKCTVLLSDNSIITVKDSFEDICKTFMNVTFIRA